MPAQLDTPRAIERFLAQVREQFRAHDLDEMNDVDLILATFLRVQFPDVFSQLQSQKSDLTKAGSSHAMLDQQKDRQPDWDDLLATLERDKDRRDALAVMAAIFPVVRDKNCPGAQPGRFAHPDYFDRYLAQAIPEGDIPDALISRVLADAAMGDDAELRILLNGGDADLATLAFSKIRARFPDVDDERFHTGPRGVVTVALLQTAMTLVDQADEDRLTSLTSAGDQLRWWSAILVRQLLDTDPTCVVDPALLKCTNIDRRAHVLDTATRDRSGLRGETQDALNNALERELDRILPVLLDDLRERDNSDATTGTAYLYTLVAESSRLEELRNQITAGLAASDFTPEDVAARLVGLGYIVGGFWPPMEGVLLRRALHESDWHRGPVG